MSQDSYTNFVQTKLSRGESPAEIAAGLPKEFPRITPEEAADTIHFLAICTRIPPAIADAAIRPSKALRAAAAPAPSPVENAAYEAWLLKISYPNYSALQIMRLVQKNYPNLTMTQTAEVMKHGPPYETFPNLTCPQMGAYLRLFFPSSTRDAMRASLAAVGYAEADIQTTLDFLFPPAPQGLTLAFGGGQIKAKWNAVQKADHYGLLVSEASGAALAPQPPVTFEGASAVIDAFKLSPATYKVQVQVLNPGITGPYCDPESVVIPQPGAVLQHRWLFQQAQGNVAADSVGGVNGTLVNASIEGGGPQGMNCVHINGDSSRVGFTNQVGQFGTRDFSVALWFQTRSNTRYFDIIGNRTASSGGVFLSLRMTGNYPGVVPGRLSAEIDDNHNYCALDSPQHNLTDGQWHHVAVVRQGAALRQYIDGARQNEGSSRGVANIVNGNELRLGRSLAGVEAIFTPDAHYADVRVYEGALTDTEVAHIVNPPAPTMTIVSGDGQQRRRDQGSGQTIHAVFAALVVQLKEGDGKPIAGQRVSWSANRPPQMGISFEPQGAASTVTTTDANGIATLNHMPGGSSVFIWYLAAPFTVTATCGSLSATFHLTVIG